MSQSSLNLLLWFLFAYPYEESKAQVNFPGITLANFANHIVIRPPSHSNSNPAFITNNPALNTAWLNLKQGRLLLTWDSPIFNGVGNDFTIVNVTNYASGTAKLRLLLSDDTYTNYQSVNLQQNMLLSTSGSILIHYYDAFSGTIEPYYCVPAAKQIDINDFYAGSLAIKGIEFSEFTDPFLDLMAVATTQFAVIPVILKTFTCRIVNNNPTIFWETETETNAISYEIERKTNNEEFLKIGQVDVTGNRGLSQNYKYIDSDILNFDFYYYRLKMIDRDGTYKYSPVVKIYIESLQLQQPVVQISNNTLAILFAKKGSKYALSNIAGHVLMKGVVTGERTLIHSVFLPPGIYLVSFDYNVSSLKLFILR